VVMTKSTRYLESLEDIAKTFGLSNHQRVGGDGRCFKVTVHLVSTL